MRLFKNRTSKPSPKWAFLRWHDIVLDGEKYLTRFHIWTTPWFSIKVHWFHRRDPDRDLHCHPWPFVSFILKGGYTELVSKTPQDPSTIKSKRVNWFNYKDIHTGHRIADADKGTVTLIVSGRRSKKKEWGFYDENTGEYTNWDEYNQ